MSYEITIDNLEKILDEYNNEGNGVSEFKLDYNEKTETLTIITAACDDSEPYQFIEKKHCTFKNWVILLYYIAQHRFHYNEYGEPYPIKVNWDW